MGCPGELIVSRLTNLVIVDDSGEDFVKADGDADR